MPSEPNYHNNFQDPEAFLRGRRPPRPAVRAAHRRHVLHQPLVRHGRDDSQDGRADRLRRRGGELLRPRRARTFGTGFRHGERVGDGERGVWERPLGPGKYAFNTYAGSIVLVPTTNFVLHWITGKSESHRYDESLRSIDLVTKDAYEPLLPLSVVVHIDYERAPSVIQRFGDVKKLITQTLDPMLSAYLPRHRPHQDDARAAARARRRFSRKPARSCGRSSASSTSSASTC